MLKQYYHKGLMFQVYVKVHGVSCTSSFQESKETLNSSVRQM